jgi:hypothetical protein
MQNSNFSGHSTPESCMSLLNCIDIFPESSNLKNLKILEKIIFDEFFLKFWFRALFVPESKNPLVSRGLRPLEIL